eukprot:scaffold952_cov409-Prasinococcus_capsulatus_cf.AAC.66
MGEGSSRRLVPTREGRTDGSWTGLIRQGSCFRDVLLTMCLPAPSLEPIARTMQVQHMPDKMLSDDRAT